ncbi:MAG: hypothetical protein K6U04_06200 [Armatimonadetes bacterium]|nr:hypothetical protein [Armatimonadota bacterium]
MSNQEFVKYFTRRKEAFLQEYNENSYKKVLNWFERWLQEEAVKTGDTPAAGDLGDFDDFLDEVLERTRERLGEWGVRMVSPSSNQWLGLKGSWRCIKVLEHRNVFYRIGKTRPRKGTYQGHELLVLDLVMDGQKKQVFLPLLSRKKEVERELGAALERELPKVEATGKYRLKMFLPFQLVERWETDLAAQKLTSFILVTKKALNKLGVV